MKHSVWYDPHKHGPVDADRFPIMIYDGRRITGQSEQTVLGFWIGTPKDRRPRAFGTESGASRYVTRGLGLGFKRRNGA